MAGYGNMYRDSVRNTNDKRVSDYNRPSYISDPMRPPATVGDDLLKNPIVLSVNERKEYFITEYSVQPKREHIPPWSEYNVPPERDHFAPRTEHTIPQSKYSIPVKHDSSVLPKTDHSVHEKDRYYDPSRRGGYSVPEKDYRIPQTEYSIPKKDSYSPLQSEYSSPKKDHYCPLKTEYSGPKRDHYSVPQQKDYPSSKKDHYSVPPRTDLTNSKTDHTIPRRDHYSAPETKYYAPPYTDHYSVPEKKYYDPSGRDYPSPETDRYYEPSPYNSDHRRHSPTRADPRTDYYGNRHGSPKKFDDYGLSDDSRSPSPDRDRPNARRVGNQPSGREPRLNTSKVSKWKQMNPFGRKSEPKYDDLYNKERSPPRTGGSTRPIRVTRTSAPTGSISKPTDEYDDLYNKQQSPPKTEGFTRPIRVTRTSAPTGSLSQPTNDINTAIEYLKAAALSDSDYNSPRAQEARRELRRQGNGGTIDSREAKRLYGDLKPSVLQGGPYMNTIDSREAARKYGGTTV